MWLSSIGSSYAPICGDGYPGTWYGNIDEYSIWDVAFTANDVTAMYNNGRGKPVESGLSWLPEGIKRSAGVDGFSGLRTSGPKIVNSKKIMGIGVG